MAAVFTYLLAQIPPVAQQIDADAQVNDGPIAANLTIPNTSIIFVGATDPINATAGDGTRDYVQLGQRKVEENFSIPCYIDASTGDPDQARARNMALAQWDGICSLIASDVTLGGALLAGRTANLTDIQIIQTDGDDEAVDGRRCVITFRVACANHYSP